MPVANDQIETLRRLAEVAGKTSNLVILTDARRRIEWVNPAFEKYTGYTLDEIKGRNPSFLQCEETAQSTVACIRQALDSGRAVQVEILNRSRSGARYWVNLDIQPTHDEAGKLTGFMAIQTDITDRKNQEQAVGSANARLKSTLSALPDRVFEVDASGRYIGFHAGASGLDGGLLLSPDKFIGKHYFDVLPPDVADVVRASMHEVDEKGVSHGQQYRYETSGGTFWFELSVAARIADDPQQPHGYIFVARDVTVRKEQEQALAQAHNRLEATLAAMPDLILEVDAEGRYTNYHVGVSDQLVIPPEAFIGKTHEEVLPRDVAAIARQVMAEVDNTGHSQGRQYSLNINGRKRWLEASAGPLESSTGGKPGYIFVTRDITDRREAQERLRYRETLFKSLFDLAPVGLALNDLETGAFIDVNDAYLAPIGYTRSELTERTFWDIIPESYWKDGVATRIEELKIAGRYQPFETEHVRKDGSRYPVLLNGILVTDTEGRELIWSFIEDVSERKQLENELITERDYLARLMETSASAITVLDDNGAIIFANREAEQVLGLSLSEVEGRSFNDPAWRITMPDGSDFPENELPFVQVKKTGKPVRNIIHAIEWPDGSRRILSVNAAPVDTSGVKARVVCTVTDITEQVEAREALKESEYRLQSATEAARIGVWTFRPDENRLYFSKGCVALVGAGQKDVEMTGEDYAGFLHPEDRDRVISAIYDHIAGRADHFTEEARYRHADGHYVWALASGRVIERAPNGRAILMSGTFQDITERKEYERQLEESRAAAEKANLAKSRFLANMSHEIRTPMNGVLGMAQLLARSDMTQKQRAYLDTLQQSGRTLLGLIEDILDISRIEAGEMRLENGVFDLLALLESVRSVLASQAEHKGLTLSVEIGPGAARMRTGDAKRLQQVLINLAGNAVKFTSEGFVKIHVQDGQDDDLLFEVEDTGPGVAEDQHALIFDRFAQTDNSMTREHDGTGLGLAICKELVELAGGRIGLRSRPGQGSVFYFSWPLRQCDAQDAETAPSSNAAQATSQRKGLILAVEDNQVNRTVLEGMLRNSGYDTAYANNGLEALEAISAQTPDAILMDLHMPVMGGEEAIQRIRAMQGPAAAIPIFVLTADATIETSVRLQRLDIQGCFTKPLDLMDILNAIDNVLMQSSVNHRKAV